MRKVLSVVILTLLVSTCVCLVGDVFSQTPQGSQPGKTPAVGSFQLEGDKVGNVGKVLFIFLALSVVFEVALTPIFNWRVFLAHFEERGWKTPLGIRMNTEERKKKAEEAKRKILRKKGGSQET